MALKQKGGGAKSIPVGLAISWAVQISLTMGLCLLLAALILSGKAGCLVQAGWASQYGSLSVVCCVVSWHTSGDCTAGF